MKHMTRILALILMLSLVFSIVSCGENNNNPSQETKSETTPETEPPSIAGFTADDIYWDETRDYVILARTPYVDDFYATAADAEVYSKAIYDRNCAIEDFFNVNIKVQEISCLWQERNQYLNTITASISTNEQAWNLIDGYAAYIGQAFKDHIFLNLLEVPNLNLDAPYWSSLMKEGLTVNNQLYAISGDLATNLWQEMQVLYFNKVLMTNLGMEFPYDLVEKGEWTKDVYLSMIKDVAAESGDTPGWDLTDRYGAMYTDDLALDNFHNAFGISYTKRNGDGTIEMDIYNEKVVETYKFCKDLVDSKDVLYIGTSDPRVASDSGDGVRRMQVMEIFAGGNILFCADLLDNAKYLRDMKDDYGLLPIPKYDTAQEHYYTTSRDGRTMFVIPRDVADSEFTGMITEAMCAKASEMIIPVYQEQVLGQKLTRDTESMKMVQYLRDGIKFDFVSEYTAQLNSAGTMIRECLYSQRDDITSFYESKLRSYTKAFDKFIAGFYEDAE